MAPCELCSVPKVQGIFHFYDALGYLHIDHIRSPEISMAPDCCMSGNA